MPLLATVAGVTGLSIGSFLNVVVWRVPRGVSIVRPASACPGCGAEIRARDNVPVLSWLMLGRRCRDCRTPISARYPMVEALTALAFVLVALFFAPAIVQAETAAGVVGASLELVAFLVLAAVSIALSAIDVELRRLPNSIVLTAFIAGVVLLVPAVILLGRPELLISAVVGGAGSFAFYLLLALIGRGGMGMGDVKLAGVLGFYLGALGWAQLAVGVGAAFAVGAIAGAITLIVRRSLADRSLPFGPWMFLGAWIGIVGGESIAAAYLRFVGLG
ncbi:prepilin peptidase [Protaetiibacter mangrovi]|uniref:Prepilin peptidase n=1 Tax=Protaetiibacter mangrovi TaxID=2970926 RepID=A0ABT1ZD48_9MICO|nr:A24 family peptidase [Protaetiibacter mangrovi]MCS0498628.1 prepilin peptidase [Protaetiibacter mangrovi]TPX02487.1 prepilin peptidase [Schumannella luteola]